MLKKIFWGISLSTVIILVISGIVVSNLSFFVQKTPWLVARWSQLERYFLGDRKKDNVPLTSRLEHLELDSSLLGTKRDLTVYLPAGYDRSTTKQYPVLYLLHGSPGEQNDWLLNADLQTQLDELISSRTIIPLIVVMPDGNGPTIIDSEYVDATKIDQPMESHFTHEIIPYVDAHFRTLTDRRFRAIGGLSSGAYGAINMGLRNLDLFGVMISHSGYFVNNEWAITELLGKKSKAWHDNNPAEYIAKLSVPQDTAIYLEVAKIDYPSFIKGSQDFATQLASRHIEHVYTESDGVHSWSSWKTAIRQSLTYTSNKWLQWGVHSNL